MTADTVALFGIPRPHLLMPREVDILAGVVLSRLGEDSPVVEEAKGRWDRLKAAMVEAEKTQSEIALSRIAMLKGLERGLSPRWAEDFARVVGAMPSTAWTGRRISVPLPAAELPGAARWRLER